MRSDPLPRESRTPLGTRGPSSLFSQWLRDRLSESLWRLALLLGLGKRGDVPDGAPPDVAMEPGEGFEVEGDPGAASLTSLRLAEPSLGPPLASLASRGVAGAAAF